MNLKKVIDIYNIIKERLPKTYPRPKLAFYEDEECLLINHKDVKIDKGDGVYAIVDPETWTINLPLKMTFEYVGRGEKTYFNTVPINKHTDEIIAGTILHEIGHLYAGERYGYGSEKYHDEKYCDLFAARWIKVLYSEGLL